MGRPLNPLPEDAPAHQKAAHQLHAAAQSHLGLTAAKQVAAVFGESPTSYSNVLSGREGSLDRIVGWLERLNAKLRHDMVIHLTGTDVEVVDLARDPWSVVRGDLDVVATLILSRDGLGNGWRDTPSLMLLAAAERAASLDFSYAGQAADHLCRVLTKGSMAPRKVEAVRGEVLTVFPAIAAYRTENRALVQRLDAVSSRIKLHSACQVEVDPRWEQLENRTWTTPNGTEVTARIAMDPEEFAEKFGNSWKFECLEWCHSEDGPAFEAREPEGAWHRYWVRWGEMHRVAGPARIECGPDGQPRVLCWAQSGGVLRSWYATSGEPIPPFG